MITYTFKTNEDINNLQRTVVKTESVPSVPATTKTGEFTLEQKEQELVQAEQTLVENQKRVDELKAEIAEVKVALEIK